MNEPNIVIFPDGLTVRLIINGRSYTANRDLGEAALKAEGPMSLESGVMSLVRELSQEIYRKMNDDSV
jgi:hypothetical protein